MTMRMRALIVGLGSIGQRHLGNLRQLVPDAEITVLRHDPSRPTPENMAKLASRIIYRLEDAFDGGLDCAIIASPAPFHMATAMPLAKRGVHLFVEKPIADRIDGVDSLIDECRQNKCALLVGYVLRYHPLLLAARSVICRGEIGRILSVRAEVGQYLPEWRAASDYRQTVSARKDLGGGALLELSHEIDYVRWLVGETTDVFAYTAQVGGLEIDVEDMAEIALRFVGGAMGSIHLDMVQTLPTRSCRIIGAEGTLVCDFSEGKLRICTRSTKQWAEQSLHELIARNNTFIAQMQHFLDCVAGCAEPRVTGQDGKRALQIALAAKESAENGKSVELMS